jgi:uncharacterized protein
MKDIGLTPSQIEMMLAIFRRIAAIVEVVLYGSRAKGNFRPESDIDLALVGVDDDLLAEAVADELDDLPLPYHFDVKAYSSIEYAPLLRHIARVGITLYRREPGVPADRADQNLCATSTSGDEVRERQ